MGRLIGSICGSEKYPRRNPHKVMGTLIQKIALHENIWVSRPPIKGPRNPTAIPKLLRIPVALPCWCTGKSLDRMAACAGNIRLVPRACSALAPINQPILGLNPHITEKKAKRIIPIRNPFLGPIASPILPPRRTKQAKSKV